MAFNRYTQFSREFFSDGDSGKEHISTQSGGNVHTVGQRENVITPVQASMDHNVPVSTSSTTSDNDKNNANNLDLDLRHSARPRTQPIGGSVSQIHGSIEAAPSGSVSTSDSISTGNSTHNTADKNASPCLQRQRGTVWAAYSSRCELDLHKAVDIAVSRTAPEKLVMVRRPAVDLNAKRTEMVALLMQHSNFAACWEVFDAVPTPFWVCEYSIVTLEHVCALPTFPTVMEVTAIAGQLLDAIVFLDRHRLAHPALSAENVLAMPDGVIKIAEPEVCKPQQSYTILPKNTHQVGHILSQLTTKSAESFKTFESSASSKGSLPMQYDLTRYPPAGLDFFGSCYTRTAAELIRHEFLSVKWHPRELTALVAVAGFVVHRFFGFSEHILT